MKSEGTYALITGASRGLGKEIAFELAKRNYNLLLVSLEDEGLENLCKELSFVFGIKAFKFEENLAKFNAVYSIARWAGKYNVNILVNNAGVGGTIAFEDATPEYLENIIQINIRVATILTRLMLPQLKAGVQAYILNVGSLASFSPIPYKTVYPASKAYIHHFSKSLAEELKNSNVLVSVVHPGPMKTNPEVIKRIESQGVIAQLNLLTAHKMAEIAIRKMFNRNSFIIPGFFNQFGRLLMEIVPKKLRNYILSVVYKREMVKEKVVTMAGKKLIKKVI